jgi:L-lactate dehydrogenase complex protein LldF
MLVHLRSRVVEAKREASRLPTPERLLAASAAWAMANPGRWGRALRAARAGRLLGRGGRRISALPPPLAAWTNTRDLPIPPRETFRDWWARTRQGGDAEEPGGGGRPAGGGTGPGPPGERGAR